MWCWSSRRRLAEAGLGGREVSGRGGLAQGDPENKKGGCCWSAGRGPRGPESTEWGRQGPGEAVSWGSQKDANVGMFQRIKQTL